MDKTDEKTRVVTIKLTEIDWQLLGVLDPAQNVEHVVYALVNHAQQGVYRPGAWERVWIHQLFGDDFVDRLEPGDPFRPTGGELVFQRPRGTAPAAGPRPPKRPRETFQQTMDRVMVKGGVR